MPQATNWKKLAVICLYENGFGKGKIFRDDLTRSQLNCIENLIANLLQSNEDLVRMGLKFIEEMKPYKELLDK